MTSSYMILSQPFVTYLLIQFLIIDGKKFIFSSLWKHLPSVLQTPLGTAENVLISEVSSFQGIVLYITSWDTRQCIDL